MCWVLVTGLDNDFFQQLKKVTSQEFPYAID